MFKVEYLCKEYTKEASQQNNIHLHTILQSRDGQIKENSIKKTLTSRHI